MGFDLGSLIGAAGSALGGIVGGGQKTDTTTSQQNLSPELQQFVDQIFAKIPGIFGRAYPQYTGERVAGPTASRTQMDPLISAMNGQMQQKIGQPNAYQTRINQVLDQTPAQISVPDLLGRGGGAGVSMTGGVGTMPITSLERQQASSPWLSGQSPTSAM